MSVYKARVSWQNSGPDFRQGQYSRVHQWQFRENHPITATAAPDIVPAPWSDPAHVDPEQAFVASLSACHMLFVLQLAAKKGYDVVSYEDQAEGVMEKNAAGRMAITRVTLHPHMRFAGDRIPDTETVEQLHESAHALCFIANSVTTRIDIEASHTRADE